MRYFLRAALVIAGLSAVACDGGPTSANQVRSVAGTWDAQFIGVIQATGTTQDDRIVMELTQSGSTVSGVLRAAGTAAALPVIGTVAANTLKYTASGNIPEIGCAAHVAGELTLNTSGTQLSGPQTHTTCQGVAVGAVSAIRR